MKAKRFDRQNPVFARAQLGVAANHSSAVPSTEHSAEADHAQADEILADVMPNQDPNISGMTPTEGTYTWQAGAIDGWCENDDYRTFFEKSIGPESRIEGYESHDGDYDDNGGYPTAIGHHRGLHEPTHMEPTSTTATNAENFPLGPIVRRI